MLAYLTTDAVVPQGLLRTLLAAAAGARSTASTSTATRAQRTRCSAHGGGPRRARPGIGADRALFAARSARSAAGSRSDVRDGEGATKLVEVAVTGARNECRRGLLVADAVANSKLVKTAWFGRDLNWGRMAAAVGLCPGSDWTREGLDQPSREGCRAGGRAVPPRRARAAPKMQEPVLRFVIDLGMGRAEPGFSPAT